MTRVVFDNTDLSEFGYTFHKNIDEVPEHDYEEVTILGKNGTLLIDNKRMKNVSESYDIAITDNSTADLDKLRNFLASKVGFKRLEDDIRADRFVMAKFDGMNSRLPSDRSKATATMNFVRKPERWLKSGETPVSTSSEDVTYTGNPATIDNPSGISTVGSLSVALNPQQNLNGYEYPWIGGSSKNKMPCGTNGTYTQSGVTVVANNGVYTITGTSTATSNILIPLAESVDLSPSTNRLAFMNTVNDGHITIGYYRDSTRVHYWAMSPQNRVAANWTDSGNEVVNAMRVDFGGGYTFNMTLSPMLFSQSDSDYTFMPWQNICPIYPANSRNILNYNDLTEAAINVGIAVNEDGTIYDSSPSSDSRSWNYASCNWQMTLPAGTYTFTIECTTPNPDSVAQCRAYKSDGTSLFTNIGSDIFKTGGTATRTFTFTEPTTIGIIVKQYSVVYRVQIERGSSATPYQPYQGIMVERTGKNILPNDLTWTTGIRNDDGNHSASGFSHYSSMFRVAPATTYTAQGLYIDDTSWRLYFLDENGNWISRTAASASVTNSFTTPANCYYMQVQVGLNGTLTSGAQIEEGSEATAYEPYQSNTYTSDLEQFVYGGTVDLVTGVLTVDRAIKTVKWSEFGNKTTLGNFVRGTYNIGTNRAVYPPTADKPQICDVAPHKAAYNEDSLHFYVNSTFINMFLPVGTDGDTEVTVCYELATPQTYQLTPQQISLLTGINYISSSDEVTVTVTEPSLLENPTLFDSKPLIRAYGHGTLIVNNQYITIAENPYEYIDIDCDIMDAFYGANNANQYVSLPNDYITLHSGNNYIAYNGTVQVTPRWYEV